MAYIMAQKHRGYVIRWSGDIQSYTVCYRRNGEQKWHGGGSLATVKADLDRMISRGWIRDREADDDVH